jgi:hypothetical protein
MKLTNEMCDAALQGAPLEVKRWLVLIVDEHKRAKEKFPKFPRDVIHAAAIVQEEAGELVRETLQVTYESGRYYDMHKEAIQTGAMVLRFLIEGAPELELEVGKTPSHVNKLY